MVIRTELELLNVYFIRLLGIELKATSGGYFLIIVAIIQHSSMQDTVNIKILALESDIASIF